MHTSLGLLTGRAYNYADPELSRYLQGFTTLERLKMLYKHGAGPRIPARRLLPGAIPAEIAAMIARLNLAH